MTTYEYHEDGSISTGAITVRPDGTTTRREETGARSKRVEKVGSEESWLLRVGASKEVRWEVLSGSELRSHALLVKREISEARLAYAREAGDAALVAREEARLVRISEWERGA